MLGEGRHMFITGKAGTGKTTLLRYFLKTTGKNVLVTAPTGIAALNLGGYTIHHAFSLRPGTTLEDVTSGGYYPGRFAKVLKRLDLLIIDEASMVRADLLDTVAAALERFGPRPGRPFGGVQIVLVGDLHQLPPVVSPAEEQFFREVYDGPYFFSAKSYSPDIFAVLNLSKVFRQQGDPRMIELLNDVRGGTLSGAAMAEMNALVDPHFEPSRDEFWLTLATTNRIAGARNREQLDALPTPEYRHDASSTGDLEGFDPPVDRYLHFKVGAQIMLVTNDPARRWSNGTLGRLVGWDPRTLTAQVELRDGKIVEVVQHTWEALQPVVEGGSLSHKVVGTYTQLPFRLAWAITIHKSQGQTVDRLIVDLSGGMFADGQLYVALSRCTSMSGLVLRKPIRPADLRVDPRVRRFVQRAAQQDDKFEPVFLAMRVVGKEGFLDRPRPIELAAITADGAELQTLINPGRDIGDARSAWGISALDALLAPSMDEAWAALGPHLAKQVPVGLDIDSTLGLIDAELKRQGQVVAMPLGRELRPDASSAEVQALTTGTALDQAKTARHMMLSRHLDLGAGTPFPAVASFGGFLLDRSEGRLRFRAASDSAEAAGRVVEALKSRPGLSTIAEARSVLCQLWAATGGVDLPIDSHQEHPDISTVLRAGARVCFTGTAERDGAPIQRGDLHDLAGARDLVPVNSVSRTRCDVLIVAEAASQSRKARQAREWGHPIFTVDEFFDWVEGGASANVDSSDRGGIGPVDLVCEALPIPEHVEG